MSMSYDAFLRYRGGSIQNATRDDAYQYILEHGKYVCVCGIICGVNRRGTRFGRPCTGRSSSSLTT